MSHQPIDIDSFDLTDMLACGDDLVRNLRDYVRWEETAKEAGKYVGLRFLSDAVRRVDFIFRELHRIGMSAANGGSRKGRRWFGPDTPEIVGRIVADPNAANPIAFTRRSSEFLQCLHTLRETTCRFMNAYRQNSMTPDPSIFSPFISAFEIAIERVRVQMQIEPLPGEPDRADLVGLNAKQQEALTYVRANGPVKGTVLARKLGIAESYLRRHIVPKLKSTGGLKNDRTKGGYYIDDA